MPLQLGDQINQSGQRSSDRKASMEAQYILYQQNIAPPTTLSHFHLRSISQVKVAGLRNAGRMNSLITKTCMAACIA